MRSSTSRARVLPIAHAGLEKDPFTIDVGERLAGAGYACVRPYNFPWWPPEEDVAVKREKFRDDRDIFLRRPPVEELLCGI